MPIHVLWRAVHVGEKRRKRDRDREAAQAAASEAADAPMVTFAYDGNGNLLPTAPGAVAAPKAGGRSRASAGRAGQGIPAAGAYDPTLSHAEVFAALLVEHQMVDEAPAVAAPVEQRVIPSSLEGPAVISQPAWPSFIEATPIFEQVSTG
jgi:hypothetical protein